MHTLELVWLRSWFLLLLCFWSGYLCLLSLSMLFPFFSIYIWISRFSLSLHFIALMLLFVYFATKRGRHGNGETWLIDCWIGLICFNSIIGCMHGVHLDCIISISFPYYCILITWLYFFLTHRFTLVIVFQCVQITSIGIVYWILMHLSIPNMCLDD